MTKGLFARVFVLIVFFGFCLYSYLDMQNGITKLRIQIPELTAKVRQIDEENMRILYEIEIFESPENLMQLASRSEFAYMKFPVSSDVLTMREAGTLITGNEPKAIRRRPQITFASGVNP